MPGPSPAPLENYDPNQVFVTFNGVSLTGLDMSTLIKVTRNKDMFTFKADVSGSGTRTKTNDRSAMVEITLTQKSASNQYLSAFAIADENTGAGFGPLTIKDNLGSDLFIGANAWIVKMPDSSYQTESDTRVWRFEVDVLVWNLGN